VKISDVRLHLTQTQYVVLLHLSQAVPRVFANVTGLPSEDTEQLSVVSKPPPTKVGDQSQSESNVLVDMEPEIRPTSKGAKPWSTIDLVVIINAVKLHLYDQGATSEESRKDHGISRFALNGSTLRYKMLSNGAAEAQVVFKSFTMSNTRPGKTAFREIIPAANHDRNQFMVLFTMSGKANDAALAIVTVDAPQIIFSMDPVFALINFFTSSPSRSPAPTPKVSDKTTQVGLQSQPEPSSTFALNFRVDLHDLSVRILEDDTRSDTRAISLSIKQILASQQVRVSDLIMQMEADSIVGHLGGVDREPRNVAAANGQRLRERTFLGRC
jgi:vacuolar protein sorting-associated protein 13A/C